MLGPSKVTADWLHVANGKVHHLIENLRVVEFGIFAIQFWCHKVPCPSHMQLQRRLAAWRGRCGCEIGRLGAPQESPIAASYASMIREKSLKMGGERKS